MDIESRKKKQFLKVIFIEFIMVVSVCFLVIFFIFWAMGYKINKNGRLEQNGLIHVITSPSGVNVKVDDTENFLRAGVSKTLSAGQHQVTISKDGFHSWQKRINIRQGFLTQLYYIHLIPINKQIENIRQIEEPLISTVSPDREKLLYSAINSTTWKKINLKNPKPDADTTLDYSDIFRSFLDKDKKFTATIESTFWSHDSSGILLKLKQDTKLSWLFLDLNDPKNSTNLTEKFAINFSNIIFNSKNPLKVWATENENLREIDLKKLTLSHILQTKVSDIYSSKDKVFYIRNNKDSTDLKCQNKAVFAYRSDIEPNNTELYCATTDHPKIVHWEYYGDEYLGILEQNKLLLQQGRNIASDNSEILKQDTIINLDFNATKLKVSENGALITVANDRKTAVYDLDTAKLYKHQEQESGTINSAMFWQVKNNKLFVYDFDETNKQEITTAEDIFSTMTPDNKWLYFITKNSDQTLFLSRLNLLP